MGLEQHVVGEIANRGRAMTVMTSDGDEQLVLDVSEPGRMRLILAPALEAAQGDSELQEPLEVPVGELGHVTCRLVLCPSQTDLTSTEVCHDP